MLGDNIISLFFKRPKNFINFPVPLNLENTRPQFKLGLFTIKRK